MVDPISGTSWQTMALGSCLGFGFAGRPVCACGALPAAALSVAAGGSAAAKAIIIAIVASIAAPSRVWRDIAAHARDAQAVEKPQRRLRIRRESVDSGASGQEPHRERACA